MDVIRRIEGLVALQSNLEKSELGNPYAFIDKQLATIYFSNKNRKPSQGDVGGGGW